MLVEKYLSDRVKPLKASAIREMFKLMAKADIISLAGGNPSAELFPGDELSKIAGKILMTSPSVALQYGTTDGYAPMKECALSRAKMVDAVGENDALIVTTGAQQAIDLAIKVLINEGDKVVVENPSFIGTLNSLRSYRADLVGVEVEADGMNMQMLEEALSKGDIKLIYTIPTFQNPSGTTMSLEKRKKLIELANKYDVVVIEDNPYGDLRFAGESVPTLKSLDTEERVIYVGSFSKILSPGMRLGYVVAHKDFCDRIEVVKQVNDVHTPVLTQMMCVEFMKKYDIDKYIEKSCKLYGDKCRFMLECMDKYFPSEIKWTAPEGGLFIWCSCPEKVNAQEFLNKCIENNVAFVPGSNFATDISAPSNMFRLNYSSVTMEKIEAGIKKIGEVYTEMYM